MNKAFGNYTDCYAYQCDDCGSLFVGDSDTEKCPRCGSEDIEISDTTRVCSHCRKLMKNGYVFYDGEAYYCSDECLHQHFSEEEYMQAYHRDDAYWSEW